MDKQQIPFEAGWWSFDLGRYRPCDGTYCYFPYDSLPPIDMTQFRGDFQWLDTYTGDNPGANATPKLPEPLSKKLKRLTQSAAKLGVSLPDSFVKFMQNKQWQDRIPSCTACYFDLSTGLIPNPLRDDTYFIRFLNDQQDVLMWYLYLQKDGDSCVIVSPIPLEDIQEEDIPADAVRSNTLYCAATFESFIYRFWLENTIWFALDSSEAMTETQKAYLAHYQKS